MDSAYQLYLDAEQHTAPSPSLDAAWSWFVKQRSPSLTFAFDTETTGATWGVKNHLEENNVVITKPHPIVFGISGAVPGPDRLHLVWGRIGTSMWAWLVSHLRMEANKVAHNLRFDMRVCRAQSIDIGPVADDTLTMARIVWDRKRKFDLQTLAEMLCPEVSDWCTPVRRELIRLRREHKKTGLPVPTFADVPDDIMGSYSMVDSFLCFLLNVRLRPTIGAEFAELYRRERDILDVIIDVENQGLQFDWRAANRHRVTLAQRKQSLIANLRGQTNDANFNPNAPAQVLTSLKRVGAPTSLLRKDGAPTSRNKVLLAMVEKLPLTKRPRIERFTKDLLEYRAIGKIDRTYLRAMSVRARQADGKIYCNINPTNARTGRMSSSGPNLQNIPRAKSPEQIGYCVKQCFIVEPGWRRWYFDYASMEFAVFGLMAGAKPILDAYAAGIDLHGAMAEIVVGKGYTDEDRQRIKAVDFGIIYGEGDKALAVSMGVSYEQAMSIRATYYDKMPEIPDYIKRCDTELRRKGYVEDYFGRRYCLPQGQGYKAVNALVQGGCAQAFKIALLRIQKQILGSDVRLVLPVHDEAQIDRKHTSRREDLSFICSVRDCMSGISQFISRGLTLRVDVAYTDTHWADKHKLEEAK